jgi:ribonuclease J
MEEAAQLDRGDVVLISEGTRVGDAGPRVTEEEVKDNIVQLMRGEARGRTVIADFGPRNIERLQAFHSAAMESGRRLVITMADAYLLDALRLADGAAPDPGDESICILQEPKAVVPQWERTVEARYKARCVSAAEIRRDPAAYMVCLSFWDISNLIDLEPERGIYIYSSAEAFNEEMSLDHQRLENWIRHFGLEPVGGLPGQVADAQRRGFHASGHISGAELEEVISAIDPRLIVPVHTEHVDWFHTRWPAKVVDVEYGRPIDLD